MKIKDIANLADAINALISLDKEKGIKLNSICRIKLACNLRLLMAELRDFNEVRQELFKRLGTVSADNPENLEVKKDSPNYAEFMSENKAMLEMERDVKLDVLNHKELFGCKPDPEDQNQIPMDILAVFMESGIFTKE